MIVFELTMPNVASWNGRWSGEKDLHVRIRRNNEVPKEYWNKDFIYSWPDGWTACVETRKVSASEARKLENRSIGFCGYDWMIESIIKNGKIISPNEKKV